MTFQALRKHSKQIGLFGMLLGLLASIAGICLGDATMLQIGCVTLFAGAYAMIFAHVGSF